MRRWAAWVCAVCGGSACGGSAGAAVDAAGSPVDAIGAGDASATHDAADDSFVPATVLVPVAPLCDVSAVDPVNIDCDVAHDRLSDRDPDDVPAALRVVAWNVEYGADAATVREALLGDPSLAADVLFLSEVARASLTSNPPDLDQARDLAMALRMDYLFAVEWDRRERASELGEHGVAILSKYPLGNVTQIRHTPQNDWYAEDQLYGGRITLAADALVGGRRVRLYSSHLCTRGGESGRATQGAEIRVDADGADRPALQIVGGDLNTWTCNPNVSDCTMPPAAERVVEDFLADGWLDGTAGWNGHTQLGEGFFPQRLDWIFARGADVTPGMRVDAAGSDHFPIYTDVTPP